MSVPNDCNNVLTVSRQSYDLGNPVAGPNKAFNLFLSDRVVRYSSHRSDIGKPISVQSHQAQHSVQMRLLHIGDFNRAIPIEIGGANGRQPSELRTEKGSRCKTPQRGTAAVFGHLPDSKSRATGQIAFHDNDFGSTVAGNVPKSRRKVLEDAGLRLVNPDPAYLGVTG